MPRPETKAFLNFFVFYGICVALALGVLTLLSIFVGNIAGN